MATRKPAQARPVRPQTPQDDDELEQAPDRADRLFLPALGAFLSLLVGIGVSALVRQLAGPGPGQLVVNLALFGSLLVLAVLLAVVRRGDRR